MTRDDTAVRGVMTRRVNQWNGLPAVTREQRRQVVRDRLERRRRRVPRRRGRAAGMTGATIPRSGT